MFGGHIPKSNIQWCKSIWVAVVLFTVIAGELAWLLFVGPADHHAIYDATCEKNCSMPWWLSSAMWTAIFTALLTVSTVLLWISTRRSTKIAYRALTELERPWIFRDKVHVQWRHTPSVTMNDWLVSLVWKNVGRAPATLTDLVFQIEDIDGMASFPDYSRCTQLDTIDAMPARDDFELETRPVGPAPGGMKDGRAIQYVFWGRLRYKEMNGTEHVSGFAVQLIPFAAGAAIHNSDAYNYYT